MDPRGADLNMQKRDIGASNKRDFRDGMALRHVTRISV